MLFKKCDSNISGCYPRKNEKDSCPLKHSNKLFMS